MESKEKSKWQSRKFWVTILTYLVGTTIFICGVAGVGESVSKWIPIAEMLGGGLIDLLVTLGYLKVEGDIDKERAKK